MPEGFSFLRQRDAPPWVGEPLAKHLVRLSDHNKSIRVDLVRGGAHLVGLCPAAGAEQDMPLRPGIRPGRADKRRAAPTLRGNAPGDLLPRIGYDNHPRRT